MVAPPPKRIGDGVSEGTAEWFRGLVKTYEGRAFYECSDSWNGHGKQVWGKRFSPYEIRCVDGREFLATFKMSKILSVPEDASEAVQRATDPSSFVITTIFHEIEPGSHFLTCVGTILDSEATTAPDDTYNPENYDATLTDIAGWMMNVPNVPPDPVPECRITEDLLIASQHKGDLKKSLNVLFAAPEEAQSGLAQLYQQPTAPENTLDKKIEQMQDYIIHGKFFQAVDGELPEVTCGYRFQSVERVDTMACAFRCVIQSVCTYITKVH